MRATLLRLLAATFPRREQRGFQFIDIGVTGLLELLTSKSLEALSLVEAHDSTSFARVGRYLKTFAVVSGAGEYYHHGLRAYVMDIGNLQRRSIPELAAAIVHEATHARLASRGFLGKRMAERNRLERICTEEEARFAERLPDGSALAAGIRAKLATPWWTDEALQSRRVEHVRASGLPKWAVAIYEKLFARRPS